MRIIPVLAFVLIFASSAHAADYGLGMSFDTSSNMLMRPGSPSGTVINLFGGAGRTLGGLSFSYDFDAGTVQHYDGVQFHRHNLELAYNLFPDASEGDSQATLKLQGALARYGEVSFLGGYHDLGASAAVKRYWGESTLLRWEGAARSRSFHDFDIENFREGETFIRLDRFLETGTTLRAQVSGGLRKYPNIASSSTTKLVDIRGRVAQSLGSKTGAWVELFNRRAYNEAAPDTSAVYDRLLFEDNYKSSAFGGTFSVKHLLNRTGSVQFRTSVEKKQFGKNTASSYWYLPRDGWDELEKEFSLALMYQPRFLPEFVHPSLEVYHIAIDSSISDLSYRTTGVILGFTLY
ncbi:MAG: hypothetical protein ACYC9O_04500 [Candidatus Latescibacterota bacterium]